MFNRALVNNDTYYNICVTSQNQNVFVTDILKR